MFLLLLVYVAYNIHRAENDSLSIIIRLSDGIIRYKEKIKWDRKNVKSRKITTCF